MIKKLASILLIIGILAISLSPMLVSATNPFYTYYSNGAYDGGLWYEATGSSAETETEYQDAYGGYFSCNITTFLTQTFTPKTDQTITKAEILIYGDAGNTNAMDLSLYATLAGKPTGASLVTATQVIGNIPLGAENATWVTFEFVPYALTIGTVYALVIDNVTGTDIEYWGYAYDLYSGGQKGVSLDSGATWTMDAALDFAFKVYSIQTPYSTAHDSSVGNISATASIDIGQMYAPLPDTQRVYRGVFFFDSSNLITEDNVQSATLQVWVGADYSTTDFDLTMVDGSGVSGPLATSDYYELGLNELDLGHITTAGISTTGYTTLTLNASGLQRISKTGYTKIGLRSSRDISGTGASGNEYVNVFSGESIHPPILTVTYTVGALGIPDEMNISGVSVYTYFQETGDMLFVWRNTLRFNEVPSVSPEAYFEVELRDDADVVQAKSVVHDWGYQPLSIYLSAAQVVTSGISWTDNFSLVMTGTTLYGTPAGFSDFTYYEVDSNWIGPCPLLLDIWVKSTTTWLEERDGVASGTYSSTNMQGGWCLNPLERAQTSFLTGIPFLDASRPNLFIMKTGQIQSVTTGTPGWAAGLYSSAWGAYWVGLFGGLGLAWGLTGNIVLGFIMGIVVIGVGAVTSDVTKDGNKALLIMAFVGIVFVALGSLAMDITMLLVILALFLLLRNVVFQAG